MNEDIQVYGSLKEISFVEFPCRMEWLLLAVCVSGEISAQIDLTMRSLTANSIMVLRPGHTVDSITESDDFSGYFIMLHESKVNLYLPSMNYFVAYSLKFLDNSIIRMTDDEASTQRTLYNLISTKLHSVSQFASKEVKALVEVLFYDTLSIYDRRNSFTENSPRRSRREDILSEFMDLVENNYRRERSVAFYAGKLCVTPKHLSTVLKEVTGRTAGEWIDYRVLLEARLMLRSSGMTVQEISEALNFANQSFFGKYFKHLTGMSPKNYRTGER